MAMTDYTTTDATQPAPVDATQDVYDTRPPALPPPPPPERKRRRLPVLLTVLLVALIAAAVAYPAGQRSVQTAPPVEEPAAEQQDAPAALDAPSPVPEIAAAVLPSVGRVDVGQGSGSAVIYREDGYLVTNFHVVQDARQVEVTLADGQRRSAEVVGTAPNFDLAVLRIDEQGLPAATFAEEVPEIGSTAVAIGSPFGLDATVTAGIISAEDRELTGNGVSLGGLIQTDAAINPGNSGGALADDRGRVVGINTAILSGSGTSAGVGFAVPASSVVAIADQIIDNGEVRSGFLGIQGGDVTPESAEAFGIPEGAVVERVTPNTAAAEAGLRPEDVITEFDGTTIDSMGALSTAVLLRQPGDEVTLKFFRDGQEQEITVTLGERPDDLTPQ
jgi:S1-C subfamily serine protease